MPTFRIHFGYVRRGRLIPSWREVEAKTVNEAIAKLWREFGWIKVWKTEQGKSL